ncbi:uncharacterized protein LOC115878949, partial [Sitophilus oryzae]|uniref:Uncharacterized protein LOC115878949 n=1 Tax=Sitophilus oryzae TaxID=7048 RepID=A0A6J2XKH1_SITOR
IVEKGAEVNIEDDFDCTPLIYACEGGKEAVKYLLPLIKDVDIQKTLLHSVKTDNGDVIDILVHSGADVNFQDADGFTPLFTAASYGNLSTVNALLNHGADPNKTTTYCGTPLQQRSFKRHNEVVKKLLKAGSGVDAIFEGKNIIHIAAEQADKDILLALLENNADALSKDKEGNTALHYAILNDCTDVIDVLIAQGIDINAKNDQFHTVLYSACRYDIPDVVKRLISHNADVSIKENCLGWSPLHRACEEGNLDVVRVLLDAGANVSDVTKFKDTPLHRAVGKGHEGIVEELVRRGGDVTAVNGRGESVLDIARKRQSKEILELLGKES